SRRHSLPNGDAGKPLVGALQWTGRTSANKIVNFEQDALRALSRENLKGRLVRVKIEKAHAHSLWGIPLNTATVPSAVKGEKSYAA
ncbi:MAG: TRAM domain-containing protein, partial [Desulfobacterales bacterium]